MCGIVGFYHKEHADEGLLRKMAETISYRGPDDEGYILMSRDDYQIGMGFKRLSILDLSTNGHQPMAFDNLVITFTTFRKYGRSWNPGDMVSILLLTQK